MSKYTTELRFICEEYAGLDESEGYMSIDEIINASYKKVFDFDFPIFDESYRDTLEKKILVHFYTREISEETVGLWKLRLRDKMNLIMPYYNQLYESELIEFDPMKNIDTHIDDDFKDRKFDHNRRTDNLDSDREYDSQKNGKTTNTDRHDDWELYSDTPQGSIDRIDLDQNAYLTNATHSYGNGGTIVDEEHSGTKGKDGTKYRGYQDRDGREFGKHTGDKDIKGMDMTKMGNTPSRLMKEYRELFLNIDAMIIAELEELFIQLW